jgi:hypothetical protein
MSTSERTINQVRAILSKLDRSIDEAREKRTHPAPAPVAAAPVPPPPPISPNQLIGGTPKPAPAVPAAPRSPFGRAQPLNRPQAPQLRWGQ